METKRLTGVSALGAIALGFAGASPLVFAQYRGTNDPGGISNPGASTSDPGNIPRREGAGPQPRVDPMVPGPPSDIPSRNAPLDSRGAVRAPDVIICPPGASPASCGQR